MLNRIIFFILIFSVSFSFVKRLKNFEVYIYGNIECFESIIWIFPGYINEKDSFRQHPDIIFSKWKLGRYTNSLVIIPYIPLTIYPLYETNNLASWLKELEDLRSTLNSEKEIFIGISSGVEGAIKFNYFRKYGNFIFISGTFDYFSIPKNSGEYKIHEKFFGNNIGCWKKENPLYILEGYRGEAYIFCEKNSIFYKQNLLLLKSKFNSFKIYPIIIGLENSYHNWDFWGSEKVISEIDLVIKRVLSER